jgi:hypothetical protein
MALEMLKTILNCLLATEKFSRFIPAKSVEARVGTGCIERDAGAPIERGEASDFGNIVTTLP